MMCDWPKCEESGVYRNPGGFTLCSMHIEVARLLKAIWNDV